MNISEVSQQLSSLLSKAGSLFLTANDDFTNQLTIGQILKGKMLRSYEGGRYAVDFNGQEKIVDSSVPLKTGELIYGRVVGLGDKVELKRLAVPGENSQLSETQPRPQILSSKWESMLREAMQDFHVEFSAQEKTAIISMLKRVEQPQSLLMSAIALVKQNLPVSEQLLQLMSEFKKERFSLLPVDQVAPRIEYVEVASDEFNSVGLTGLINEFMRLVDEQKHITREFFEKNAMQSQSEETSVYSQEQERFDHNQNFAMKWQLLNSQIDGAVQHRVVTLPIWLADRLVEVNIAIYEQNKKHQHSEDINFRKIIFSLQLENLGQVDIEIILQNKNARLHISSDSRDSTEYLLEYAAGLNRDLNHHAWSLDEVAYSTKTSDEQGNVLNSIIQHYVAQDSLSQLM